MAYNIDAANGWYRYEAQFAVPINNIKREIDHYNVYSGTLVIRNDANGEPYLYDLIDIEKKKVISATPFSAAKRSGVTAPKPSSAANYNSTNSGSQANSTTASQTTSSISSGQLREVNYTSQDLLEYASNSIDRSKLTEGQRTALDTFDKNLNELRSLQAKRDEQSALIKQYRAEGNAEELRKAENRRSVYNRQI